MSALKVETVGLSRAMSTPQVEMEGLSGELTTLEVEMSGCYLPCLGFGFCGVRKIKP